MWCHSGKFNHPQIRVPKSVSPNSWFSSFPPNKCCYQKTFQCEQLKWNKQLKTKWQSYTCVALCCVVCLLFSFVVFFVVFFCAGESCIPVNQAAGSALDRWASAPKVPGESSASFAVEKSRPSVSFAKEPLGEAEVVDWVGHLAGANHREDENKWGFLFKFMISVMNIPGRKFGEPAWAGWWWTSLYLLEYVRSNHCSL